VKVAGSSRFHLEHGVTFGPQLVGEVLSGHGAGVVVTVDSEHVRAHGEGVTGTTGHGLGHVGEPPGTLVVLVNWERPGVIGVGDQRGQRAWLRGSAEIVRRNLGRRRSGNP
jgi:hypothetical protein